MVAVAEELASVLAREYEQRGDIDLAGFIDGCRRSIGPDEIAELIDADGRLRIDRDLPVTLSRYLDAVPDLAAMPVALDAAIEFTLRSISGDGTPPVAVVASLIAEYPMFERAIRAASLLSEALWTTEQVRADAGSARDLAVPSDFGPQLPSGQRRYELREVLGSGAQGGVYLAVDRHLSDRTKPAWVAIKVLRQSVGDAVGRERLIEEATRARRIEHPNVVRVLDRGVSDEGHDYIVYEYVNGPTLRGWRQASGEPLAPRDAAALVAMIARGVQAAHSVGVVHCDIKPDNIVIPRSTGEPKVTDFGLAVRVDTEDDAVSARPSDGPMGNLGFISPEQFRLAEGAIAPPADVYACGGVLYYLLTGLLPNGQSVEEVERNLDAMEGRLEPPSLHDARPEVDADLDAICRRALAPRPADRYGSAEALASDLESWLRREPIRWNRPSSGRRLRLFCRREPLAVAMLVLLLATVGLASGIGVAIAREGERRVMQEQIDAAAEIKRQTLEYHQRQTGLVSSVIDALEQSKRSGLRSDWLMIMMVLETLLGPELTRDSDHWADLRSDRIDQVRELVNEPLNDGRVPTLESLLWETMLGYYMLRDDRGEESIAVLTRNRESLAARLDANDPYLLMIDQMLACGVIVKVKLLSREDRASLMHEVEDAASFLSEQELTFRGRHAGSSLHRTVLECLREAYGQGMLDRPAAGKAVRAKIYEFLVER